MPVPEISKEARMKGCYDSDDKLIQHFYNQKVDIKV